MNKPIYHERKELVSMNHTNNSNHYIFQKIATLCGLRISLYITLALLILSFLVLNFTGYRTASPLYIIVFAAILPEWIQMVVFPKTENKKGKREDKLPFPLFCQKYRYTIRYHKSMNLASIILFLMLGAWHISYYNSNTLPTIVMIIPLSIAIINIITRLFTTIIYQIYFTHFPLKAMR